MEVLLYDGSMEGFLTAVYHVYVDLCAPLLYRKAQYAVNLIDSPREVVPMEAEAARVRRAMQEKFPEEALKTIHYARNHEGRDAPRLLMQYVIRAFKDPRQSLNYQDPLVMRVVKLARQVMLESHRFMGFVRFSEVQGIYVAKIEPDHDILEFLPEHFLDRYPGQRFLIYDAKRRKALLGKEGRSLIRQDFDFDENLLKEDVFTDYWQTYFQHITIAARKNPKAQKRSMPARYWKNLAETQGNGDSPTRSTRQSSPALAPDTNPSLGEAKDS